MKKLLIVSAVLAGLSMGLENAQALEIDRAGSWFVGPIFGYYNPDSSRNMDNEVTGGLQGGYNFTNLLGVEASANYFKPTDQATNETKEAYFAHLDGIFDLPTKARVTPYLAAGFGGLRITETRFAVDYGFGLEVFPAENFSFSANYRHITQFGPQENDNMLYGALNFYFGNGEVVKAIPMPTPKPKSKPIETADQFREESRYILPSGFPPCQTVAQTGCISLNGNQMSMNLDVKYANDQYVILGSYEPELDSLGKFLVAYPSINLTINGYTSNTGTYVHNQVLSEHRAESVKKYLINHFNIAPTRLSTKGWSWNNPVATNKTAEGQAENRRVEAVAAVPLKPTLVKIKIN